MRTLAWLRTLVFCWLPAAVVSPGAVSLPPVDTAEGYVSALLINEVAFPGERGYVSEADTRRAMENILLVLDARLYFTPAPYTRWQVAMTDSDSLLDIIAAGGVHGQVEGFYRDDSGRLRTAPRVTERLEYLLEIANTGAPGRFARLILHARSLAEDYLEALRRPYNLFAGLKWVHGIRVTGRAYSWMTDRDYFHSGGNFVRIPNQQGGSLSGNRFFTLRAQDVQ